MAARGGQKEKGRGMRQHQYFVYLLTNHSRTLYIGVTNDLMRRVYEHKNGLLPGFTSKYRIGMLVYYEAFSDIRQAIAREKELKAWRRSKKVALIEAENPHWDDLSETWFGPTEHAGDSESARVPPSR